MIDKARTGSTRIGRGTKIDNLVHIGHNCSIGEHCVIVAQVGISGSCDIGSGVILAGQVGVKDHVRIGDGVIVGAKSGVLSDLEPGVFVSGYYARPHQTELRTRIASEHVPDLLRQVKALEARLAQLEVRSASPTAKIAELADAA
jgi:UDP-3-O-[3-hydroxymyristoyl] glucosamine N-acyltransferase